jgi:tetratricopeptide (TPR) repeat protein
VNEASELLSAVCIEAVPQTQRSPLPLYYLAYFEHIQAQEKRAVAYLRKAGSIYRDYVFPSRPEAVEVFKYAVKKNPDDAHAHLHLGNLYGHLGRLDEAHWHWLRASKLDSSLSIAFRNLGLYTWAAQNDLTKAAEYYKKAIAANAKDQTLYRDLADILLADNNRPDAIKVLESTQYEKMRRADVLIMLAQGYLDEQRYTDAIDLLESTPYFVNWEGQTITWDIFNQAHVARGRKRFEKGDYKAALQDFETALTYPENIGVGRPTLSQADMIGRSVAGPQETSAQYWRGKALQGLGRLEQARSAWRAGASGQEGSEEQNKYIQLCTEALLKTK